MVPEHIVHDVVARIYYEWMNDGLPEWTDKIVPSNETQEEAVRFADLVIQRLATGPHRISRQKLDRMDVILLTLLDADRPMSRPELRTLIGRAGEPGGMSSEDYDHAVATLMRIDMVVVEPVEQRPAGSSQRIMLTQKGHQKALEKAGIISKDST